MFPVYNQLFVHFNLSKIWSYTYDVAIPVVRHNMQMRPKRRRVVCRCLDETRGVKCSGDHWKKVVTSRIPVQNPGSDVICCYGCEKLCETL